MSTRLNGLVTRTAPSNREPEGDVDRNGSRRRRVGLAAVGVAGIVLVRRLRRRGTDTDDEAETEPATESSEPEADEPPETTTDGSRVKKILGAVTVAAILGFLLRSR